MRIAGRENTQATAVGIEFHNIGTVQFIGDAVVAHIAAGTDRDIDLRTILTDEKIASPMIVIAAGGQVDDFLPFADDLRCAGLIRIAPDAVGIGDIERISDQRHSKRLVESAKKCRAYIDCSRAFGIAQQRDAVRARHDGAVVALEPCLETVHDRFWFCGYCRRFRNEHIAVR